MQKNIILASSAEQIRNWNGPALFGYGFRPFFLGAAVFAALAMAVWIGALAGLWTIPSAFGPAWLFAVSTGMSEETAAGYLEELSNYGRKYDPSQEPMSFECKTRLNRVRCEEVQ